MKPGRNALAASRSLMPASRSSLTSRSWRVAWARSTRPLAWLELAHRISMLRSAKARPNWVHAVASCGLLLADPENRRLVGVERDRFAVRLQRAPEDLKIREGAL